jgi:hypothetical protein
VARRALFTTKNLWVTPYQEGQLYPAGKYVFQSWQDSGLAQWTKQVGGTTKCVLRPHFLPFQGPSLIAVFPEFNVFGCFWGRGKSSEAGRIQGWRSDQAGG